MLDTVLSPLPLTQAETFEAGATASQFYVQGHWNTGAVWQNHVVIH